MSGNGNQPTKPGQITVTSADGYTVTINADKLSTAATDVNTDSTNTTAMHGQLKSTLVPAAAFGTIPHGPTVAASLLTSFNEHVGAINGMGMSLTDLSGRIQQAATMAFDSEPVTRKVASLNAPNGMLTPAQTKPAHPAGS